MAGSVAKRPNGRWRARYRDEAGKEHSRHFNRKVDAHRWLDEVTTSVVTGNYVDPQAGKISFELFYAGWAPRQAWVPATRLNADQATSSFSFADLPMKSIRRSHVEAWVKAMSATLAPTTIKTRYVIVRSVFRAAVADRIIASDPSEGITLPRLRKHDAAMTIPTLNEVGRLVANADSGRVSTRRGFRAYVALCAFAGLRKGEAAAVKVGDISASGLIAAGCDVVTVQRALGHASATTTLNTYSHLWPTAEDRTRSAASGLMREALGIPADSPRTATP